MSGDPKRKFPFWKKCKRCHYSGHDEKECFRIYDKEGRMCASKQEHRNEDKSRHKREEIRDDSIQCEFSPWRLLTNRNIKKIGTMPAIYEIAITKKVCLLNAFKSR